MVLALNKTHADVNILVDSHTAILCYLKDKLIEKLMLNPVITPALIKWLSGEGASSLFKTLDVDNGIRNGLRELFLSHGASAEYIQLDKLMTDALEYVEFPCDPQRDPVLSAACELLKATARTPQSLYKQSLSIMQEKLKKGDFNRQDTYIYDFNYVYKLHNELQANKDLLMLSGKMTEADCNDILNQTISTLEKNPFSLSDDMKVKLAECYQTLHKAAHDELKEFIENFFAHWYDNHQAIDEKRRLYGMLLDEKIRQKITLTDEAITNLKSTSVDNELKLTPYLINRIFLHAIYQSTWSDEFLWLCKETLAFIDNHFNQAAPTVVTTALYHDSYSELLPQLKYLCHLYEDNSQANIERPMGMLLWPGQVKTAAEWKAVFGLLSGKNALAVLKEYSVKIKRAISNGDQLADCLSALPDEMRIALIALLGDQLKTIIKDGYQLADFLSELPDEKRIAIIALLGDQLKAIIKNGPQLACCLGVLPDERRIAIIELLGDQLKAIIEDGYQLAGCLHQLPDEKRSALIALLGDQLKAIIKDGYQLARCLQQLPDEKRIALIELLWDQLKAIIEDGNQLADCLSVLPDEKRIAIIELLWDQLKAIIKEGNQLARCLHELPDEKRIALIELLWDQLKSIIKDGDQLANCLSDLSDVKHIAIIELLWDQLKAIIKDGDQLADCLSELPDEKRTALIALLGDQLKAIIEDGYQLADCLSMLPDEKRIAIIELLGDQLKAIIDDGYQLTDCLSELPGEKRIAIIALLGDQLKTIIKEGNQLARCLHELPGEERIAIIALLGDQLKAIIKNSDQLAKCLDMLPNEKRIAIIELLRDQLKTIIKNGDQLAKCLHQLPHEKRSALIALLGDQLKAIIENGGQLAYCLRLLPSEKRSALIELLGDQLNTIIKNGDQFAGCLSVLPANIIDEQALAKTCQAYTPSSSYLVLSKLFLLHKIASKLQQPNFTRADILELFAQIKDTDGEYKALHQQRNNHWDVFRLYLFGNHHPSGDNRPFWHTAIYQKAVNLLKEAYILRGPNDQTDRDRQDETEGLINYTRRNFFGNATLTETKSQLMAKS